MIFLVVQIKYVKKQNQNLFKKIIKLDIEHKIKTVSLTMISSTLKFYSTRSSNIDHRLSIK